MFLWGTLPDGIDIDVLVQDAFRHKILLMRGAAFSASDASNRYIRFNIAFSQQPRLSEYLKERLGAIKAAQSLIVQGRGKTSSTT